MGNPKNFLIALKDNNGSQITHIENYVQSISWDWNRIGGCGGCKIKIADEYNGALASTFNEDYQIEIFSPSASGTAELWYAGYIDKVTPMVNANSESVSISCLGYVNQLKRAVVDNRTYSGEVSAIVRSVAEEFGTGITEVVSEAANYDEVDFTVDTIYFNESVYAAVKKLADISGKREWGVGSDKKLFFKERNDQAVRFYDINKDFTTWKPIRDYNPIITKIYLKGGGGYNGVFKVTNRSTTREKVLSNSSILSQSVGQQYARMWLKENGIPKRSYVGTIAQYNARLEKTLPIGAAEVNLKRGLKVKYDIAANLYDGGLKYDANTESYQINRIRYTMIDDEFKVQLYFGDIPQNLSDELDRFEYELTQERNTE